MWILWQWLGLDHWEFHGMVLWLVHVDSMGLHRGLVNGNTIGMSTWGSHGIAWVMVHRITMEVPWNAHWVGSP